MHVYREDRVAAKNRSKARKRAIDIMFESDIRDRPLEVTLAERETDPEYPIPAYTRVLVALVDNHLEDVDRRLHAAIRGWELGRIPAVDRSILRLAVAEMMHSPPEDPTPHAVVVAEAVKLAEQLAGDGSPRFVMGVLNGVLSNDAAERAAAAEAEAARAAAEREAEAAREAAAAAAPEASDAGAVAPEAPVGDASAQAEVSVAEPAVEAGVSVADDEDPFGPLDPSGSAK